MWRNVWNPCPIPWQVERKCLPMDLVLRDAAVSRLWVLGSLARKATCCLLHTLVTQLEHAAPHPLSRGWLPASVRVHALDHSEELRVLPSGRMVIVDQRALSAVLVFPADFDVKQYLLIHHTVDRGSTGAALLHFAQHAKLLWIMSWGVFHDAWNSIKTRRRESSVGCGGRRS